MTYSQTANFNYFRQERIVLQSVQKSASVLRQEKRAVLLKKMKRYKYVYLLMLPAVLLTLILAYLPVGGLIMAFQDYDIIKGIGGSPFVGLDNFIKIFSTPKFLHAIRNTVTYSGVGILFGTWTPIILAILINEITAARFKKLVQTISYLPHFLSWVSVVGILYGIFAINGSYNDIMTSILGDSYERTNILTDPDNFLGLMFWSNQWKNIGWSSIVYLAAIVGVDQSLYEAATVDGCNKFKQIIHITIPGIFPTIAVLFIMNISGLLASNFEQVFGLQNIFTQEKTEVISTLVYRMGILNGEYSMSTAFGLANGIVSFFLVYTTNLISKKLSGIGLW